MSLGLNPASVDIKDLLDGDSDLGLTYATDLFVAEQPTTPDQCVTVFDSPGEAPDTEIVYQRPGVQVMVRGAKRDYLGAHQLAQDVRDFLHGTAGETINDCRYIGIWAEGDIISLGMDDNGRPLLSVNFRIHRTTT